MVLETPRRLEEGLAACGSVHYETAEEAGERQRLEGAGAVRGLSRWTVHYRRPRKVAEGSGWKVQGP